MSGAFERPDPDIEKAIRLAGFIGGVDRLEVAGGIEDIEGIISPQARLGRMCERALAAMPPSSDPMPRTRESTLVPIDTVGREPMYQLGLKLGVGYGVVRDVQPPENHPYADFWQPTSFTGEWWVHLAPGETFEGSSVPASPLEIMREGRVYTSLTVWLEELGDSADPETESRLAIANSLVDIFAVAYGPGLHD